MCTSHDVAAIIARKSLRFFYIFDRVVWTFTNLLTMLSKQIDVNVRSRGKESGNRGAVNGRNWTPLKAGKPS